MEADTRKDKVVPVTRAKPFLEEKLRQLELDLVSIPDTREWKESSREKASTLLKHREVYLQLHHQLEKELKELLKDYAGYENPPVLNHHPVFHDLKKNEWITAREGQYLLGSLDLDAEGEGMIVEWCSRLESLENQVSKLKQTILNLSEEKKSDLREEEMVKLEKMIEQQKALIQESLKLQQDSQKSINREKRVLQQQTKSVSGRLEEVEKKEEAVLLQRQKLAENQALLLAHEERLDNREKDLLQDREILNKTLEMLKKQEQAFLEGTTRIANLQRELQGKSGQSVVRKKHGEESSSEIFETHQSLLEQQRQLLDGIESVSSRLDQDKIWIKSLLKGLLDQQEKFQQKEEKIREREQEAMTRQDAELNQKRGWIKVEKAKLRKKQSNDEVADSFL